MSIYCGREFSAGDIGTIERLMEQDPSLKRSPLSRKLCELWHWTKPNGQLKVGNRHPERTDGGWE